MKNRFRELSESRKIAMLHMTVEEIYNDVYQEGFEKGYHVGIYNERTGACEEPAPKTANQRRAELIQRARRFVEVKFEPHWRIKNLLVIPIGSYVYTAEFITNSKKRTVVVLLRMVSSKQVIFKGKAKCAPGDVFNEWIGKAIALARALEIEIPAKLLNAVQPTEKVLGMKVITRRDARVKQIVTSENYIPLRNECVPNSSDAVNSVIIDDTNAEYEVAS